MTRGVARSYALGPVDRLLKGELISKSSAQIATEQRAVALVSGAALAAHCRAVHHGGQPQSDCAACRELKAKMEGGRR